MRKKRQWNKYRESVNVPMILLWVFCIVASLIGLYEFRKFNSVPPEKQKTESTTNIIIDGTDWNASVNYIKKTESFQPVPYQLGGYWYIGYGHQIRPGECWEQISEHQATELLEKDLLHLINYSSSRYKLTGSQSLALGMLFYNVRHSSICSSVMDAELKKGPKCWDEEKIQESWAKLCRFEGKEHAGLRERREFEIRLFFGHDK